jgi:hypothetical protein
MAKNEGMPNMVELSDAVVNNLRAKGRSEIRGFGTPLTKNFEQWLSYLIETPPWLSEANQARNKADFLDVSLAVHEVLEERQRSTVMSNPCPPWLERLVKKWHERKETVITFNYDQFVELAWLLHTSDPVPADRKRGSTDLYPVPVAPIEARVGNVQVFNGGGVAILGVSPPPDGLTLLKLHGSIGWWYSGPDSPPGDIVYDWGVDGSDWSVKGIGPADPALSDRLTIDRQPMIVPPAAIKSAYYSNRTLRALWERAAAALNKAEELVIIGFSLPATDMLVSSMLCTEFELTEDSRIVPVDFGHPNPDPNNAVDFGDTVVGRICKTFDIKKENKCLITEYANGGDDAIPKWVEAFVN